MTQSNYLAITPAEVTRFWRQVHRHRPDACWTWLGRTKVGGGYGAVHLHSRRPVPIGAHRIAYQLLVGTVPDGLVLDHLCRNPPCVNPAHLEPVTTAENIRRGEGPTARHQRKGHCPRGHPYDEANTRIYRYRGRDGRRCRQCDNTHQLIGGSNATKTHCKRGHPFDDENTYITQEGWRRCKTCKSMKYRRLIKAERQQP